METDETNKENIKAHLKVRYTLEELLEGINDENLHGETDFGEDVGKEIVEY
jgi:antitoxin component of MazEF toxin-antitoxin module